MPAINVLDAKRHTCPFNAFAPCQGAQCMAWTWEGQPYECCETDNLVQMEDGAIRPVGDARSPEGDGWRADGLPFAKGYHQSAKLGLPPGKAQRWIRERPRALGSCGRTARHDDIPF